MVWEGAGASPYSADSLGEHNKIWILFIIGEFGAMLYGMQQD